MEFQNILNGVHVGVLWSFALAIFFLDLKGLLSVKVLKRFALCIFVYLFIIAMMKSLLQWNIWSEHPLSVHLLPPENATYFYSYVFSRFFLFVLATGFFAALFGLFLFILKRYSHERLVSGEELWLGIVAALLVGWPVSLVLVCFVFLAMMLARVVYGKPSLAPFLFIGLIVMLLFGSQMITAMHLNVLKI